MPSPLVVVRWHGDVIATHDAFPLGLEDPPEGLPAEEIPVAVDDEASSASTPPEESIQGEIVTEASQGTDDVTASPTTCARAPAAANNGPKCRRAVVFNAIQKTPTCYVDTVAKEGQSG